MRVEFGLLGDVEVWGDGQRIDVGHARQRCVLVALLVDVNRPVPSDQLIDRIWADQPPHRARNALAGYLSRLRSLLADADDVRLTHETGGYVLAAEPSSVDVHRFRRLVAEARDTSDPVAALALFDEALAAWRGVPFATIDTPWVNDVRAALEAERQAAVLDRNDVGLQAGRHGELLVSLVAAMRAHPLDERVAGQLMLAQYRCGRQADALETYGQMRTRLVEELGADPSPALRQVHQQLLDGDRDTPMVAPRPVPRPRPQATLPRRVTSFVGREQDVPRVSSALDSAPLVTLTGVGGVGKSRLATEVVGRVQDRFEDGAWMCELAALDDGGSVSNAVASTLRLQQRHGLDIEGTVIEYLQPRRLILIVDNCEHVLESAARLVAQIVAHCPAVTVLATSREALGIEGERVLPLAPLPADDAATLFEDRARAGRPDFDLESEPVGAVAAICRRLDGLPLAIELAAARMRMMSSLDLARRLDRGVRLLSGGVRGALPRHQSLAATVEWSYQLLAAPEQDLFIRLSVFAGGFDLEAAHGVCGRPGATEHDTLDLLTGLVDKSMVTVRSGPDRTRYLVLETMRAYGRELLQDKGIDELNARRHAEYFTDLAVRAAVEMHGADEQAWVERILPDYDNLRAAFERASLDASGTDEAAGADLALRLVTSLPELAHLRVGYESAGWAERTLEFADPDHPLFPAAAGVAARGAWNRGDFAAARSLAARAGGRFPIRGSGRVAYPADVLADVALYEGDEAAALAHYVGEARRARADEDPIRLVWTLFYVAICHAALRNPEAGVDAAEESVRVSDATGNPTARSMARYALGLVLKKSEPERALALFDEAAGLAAAVQNFWWHGIALMEAAATRAVHGDERVAARALLDVLEHWDRVGDWSQQWLNLRYVTRFLARVGVADDAATLHGALVAAGRPSPLDPTVAPDPAPGAVPLTGAEAVALARVGLGRL